ncbi:Uncharacterised protein [Leminorella richardii]|uniref:Uncharacterized protein n=1 Tax=Leminorella richardii TaxID=158841 RepID=A0A2X4UJP2_9GAMM|nr:hypothetical protein [Leminorella richardii]SQI40097.1 Uncharacterised protein [Leminorella richardii]
MNKVRYRVTIEPLSNDDSSIGESVIEISDSQLIHRLISQENINRKAASDRLPLSYFRRASKRPIPSIE